MLIPDPRRTPLPNLISHNGVILYQWEFLRARLDEGEGLPWIAMDRALVLGSGSGMCVCSSHVKVALRHVLGRVDMHASVLWSKLAT